MFGATPPTPDTIPDPTTTSITAYTKAVQRQVRSIQRATTLAHTAYRDRAHTTIPQDMVTAQLQPGKLAMLLRPAHNKLLTANSGPYLVTKLTPPHVHLQSLVTGHTLLENTKNVRPIHLHFQAPGA